MNSLSREDLDIINQQRQELLSVMSQEELNDRIEKGASLSQIYQTHRRIIEDSNPWQLSF